MAEPCGLKQYEKLIGFSSISFRRQRTLEFDKQEDNIFIYMPLEGFKEKDLRFLFIAQCQ